MQKIIKKYSGDIITLFYSFFLVSPSLFYYFAEKKITGYMPLFIALQILLVLSPVLLLNISKRIWNYLTIPFFLLAVAQWGNFSLFKFELTEGAILAILDTSLNESNDFFKILPNSFWFALLFLFGLLIFEMRRSKLATAKVKHVKKITLLLIAVLLAPKFIRSPSTATISELLSKSYPVRNIITLVKSIQLRSSYQESLKGFNNVDVVAKTFKENEVNILVIGESARKQNHSLYGYTRNTNKYTQELGAKLHTFNRAFAASNSTIMSLKNTLTKTTSDGAVYSLPGIMKAVGSNVTWISNQGKYGEHLSLLSMIANTGNESIYINNSDFGGVSYDVKVLPYVQKELAKDGSLFIIVHLLGSHFNYIRRYPSEFDVFSGKKIEGKTVEQSEVINKYDNSILYTDYVLAEIIKLLQVDKRSASLTYFSDHGEILYDANHDFYGHGGGREATKYELEIPFFTWMNKSYSSILRRNRIATRENLPISLIDFIPFYLDFVGVEVENVPILKQYSENINYYNSKDELVPYNN